MHLNLPPCRNCLQTWIIFVGCKRLWSVCVQIYEFVVPTVAAKPAIIPALEMASFSARHQTSRSCWSCACSRNSLLCKIQDVGVGPSLNYTTINSEHESLLVKSSSRPSRAVSRDQSLPHSAIALWIKSVALLWHLKWKKTWRIMNRSGFWADQRPGGKYTWRVVLRHKPEVPKPACLPCLEAAMTGIVAQAWGTPFQSWIMGHFLACYMWELDQGTITRIATNCMEFARYHSCPPPTARIIDLCAVAMRFVEVRIKSATSDS